MLACSESFTGNSVFFRLLLAASADSLEAEPEACFLLGAMALGVPLHVHHVVKPGKMGGLLWRVFARPLDVMSVYMMMWPTVAIHIECQGTTLRRLHG